MVTIFSFDHMTGENQNRVTQKGQPYHNEKIVSDNRQFAAVCTLVSLGLSSLM